MLARTRASLAGLAVFLGMPVLSLQSASGDVEQFTMHLEEDAPGYDYARIDPPSLSYCQSRCSADSQCKAFTYNRIKRVCFLKYNAGFPLRPHGEAITGRKIRGNRFSIRRNKDAPGHDYERLDPPTLSGCESRCGAEPECRAFSYNVPKKVCFLKYSDNIPLIRHSEAITGIKVSEVSPPKRSQFSSGTGFAVSGDGLILTNQHVVEGCNVIAVEGFGAGTLKAQDRRHDLALVAFEGHPSPVTFRTGSVQQGETVYAAGYPYSGILGLNFTDGIVSSLAGLEGDTTLLQFTAPIQPGNSGGALLDKSGQVVGVINSRMHDIETLKASGSLPQNVNFAIHGDLAQRFLKANGIEPVTISPSDALPPSEIAKRAKFYTYRLTCIKRASKR
jgi:S1-C subfamily serine protease